MLKMNNIEINGKSVSINKSSNIAEDNFIKAITCLKFKKWADSIDSKYDIRSIYIQSVDMFGPNIGFIKLNCEAYFNDKPVPGIVFIRGASVSILIILILPNGDKHILLVVQPRIAIGCSSYVEAVAGMMDENGNFVGVAAKEIKEETGLNIVERDLIPLGSIYPSPGGCDECIELYAYECGISEEEFVELQGKATGCIEEGEQIILKTIPYSEIIHSNDPKLLCAWARYEQMSLLSK
jgi:ADP-sugar diphosphatase